MVVMRSIALGLDLQEDFFDDKIDKQCHNLRLLSYPPIKRAILDKDTDQARAGAHSGMHNFYFTPHETAAHDLRTDYGTLTLLFQVIPKALLYR